MAERGKELLTADERLEYVSIRSNLSEWELAAYEGKYIVNEEETAIVRLILSAALPVLDTARF